MSSKEYLLLNIIFAALLFISFSAGFVLDQNAFMSCQVLEVTGKECTGCGLTRDFMAFSQLDFQTPINPRSIFVFLWLVAQMCLRITIAILPSMAERKIMVYDLIFSLTTGVIVFLPFWL